MDIPFKLTFYLQNDEYGVPFSDFSTDFNTAIENVDEYNFLCKELIDLRLKFETDNPNLSLWIELMDILPAESFYNHEQERFCSSSEIRPLYLNYKSRYNTQKIEYSSFLPGLYRMVVYENNVEKYYSFIKVSSLHINEEQLNIMREDVESILNGLAKEVSHTKRLSVLTNDDEIMQKYNFLVEKAELLITNLKIIVKEPRYNINKVYISKSKGQASKSDPYTLKQSQMNFKNPHKSLGFKYDLNYNISFNNNLKEMLQYILKEVKLVKNFLVRNIEILHKEIQTQSIYKSPILELTKKYEILELHLAKLNQLNANIIFTLNQPWLSDLKSNMKNQDKLPRVPYYRTIYSLYQQIKKNTVPELNPFQNYIYSWKESSKLYEIWGFLKFLTMLKENDKLEISHSSGWIFDKSYDKILPFLASETKISLANDDGLELIIRYDSFIAKKKEDASFENSIITIEANNRPDMRIDIYYKGFFKGCIIAEFKYRKRDKIGNQELYSLNRHHKTVYQQIKNYKEVRSFYVDRDKKNPRKKESKSAITKVFAVFPKTNEETDYFKIESLTDIVICSLSPGVTYEKINEKINDIIVDLIDE